ncbi:hypothetical protein TNCT_99041 [Trichonephila clavata]|uniref:Uncharacterized protein n=1 Tax=Trichonephila clavata TaxID=2740835 RepID=A0A8X6J1L9_TRICU|nr:hypothetical protein TNCT_99041 [Trichonephila clavata]
MGRNSSFTKMSPQIQNEFIEILGNKIRQVIIGRVQKAKYYTMIFDYTLNTSHKDQTSQVVRYVIIENQKVRAEESFIDFIETKNKTAEGAKKEDLRRIASELEQCVSDKLTVMDLMDLIKNCDRCKNDPDSVHELANLIIEERKSEESQQLELEKNQRKS